MRIIGFQVTNFRNIRDSGWINLCDVTAFVGQNEAGKSNLFEALHCINPFLDAEYDINEDWPVDDWPGKDDAEGSLVCKAKFELDADEIESLFEKATLKQAEDGDSGRATSSVVRNLPEKLILTASRSYCEVTKFQFDGVAEDEFNPEVVENWLKTNLPLFVYIHDYEMSGSQVELTDLNQRLSQVGGDRHKLSNEDQTILVILYLAKIDLDDVLEKGGTAQGRTIRSFDKRSASQYLTNQFQKLWSQKKVHFDIDIDGPTFNIFAKDEEVNMPVRLSRRSTGFRWYVSFAWKFTHASKGDFHNCVLLLEEPGIHLHYSGQKDLLEVFDSLSEYNTVLYTTHLASMVDLSNPERTRIVESRDHHLAITEGVVSSQQAPMAVIEKSLGLTPDLSGMLGNRKVLIVEGGTDALIINKLSGLLRKEGDEGLSDSIYIWPAQTATKTPMYAAFAIGQKWDAAVLLDSDVAGNTAKEKIEELYVKKIAEENGNKFRILMLGKGASLSKTDAAIEDLFPDEFYLDCVNEAFGLAIKQEDLPQDGSDMIATMVETVLKTRYSIGLDKKRVLGVMLKKFDSWKTVDDLPGNTYENAKTLLQKINNTLAADLT